MLLLHQITSHCLTFQKASFRENIKTNHETDDKIRDKKLNNINGETAKISAFSSGKKIDKNENLAGKEIIPSDQSRVIELAKQIEAKKL